MCLKHLLVQFFMVYFFTFSGPLAFSGFYYSYVAAHCIFFCFLILVASSVQRQGAGGFLTHES